MDIDEVPPIPRTSAGYDRLAAEVEALRAELDRLTSEPYRKAVIDRLKAQKAEVEALRAERDWLRVHLRPAAEGETGQYVPQYVIDANYRVLNTLQAEVESLRAEKERLCADALAAEARADETIAELHAAVERVRALHWPSEATVDLPAVCVECVKDWPCPTVRAREA